jgi:toxin ParE1/3/4
MNRVRKSPATLEDLLQIWLRIAVDSVFHADRFLDFLDGKLSLLADVPGMGRPRPDLGTGLRAFPVDSYLIIFRVADHGIEIIRVLHAARDIESIFHDESGGTMP